MNKKSTVLMILDGYGICDEELGNAIKLSKTPNMNSIMDKWGCVKGYASGLSVGLPDGQMGNSEVGHLNMGAGRIIYQDLTKITKDIEDGDFFSNTALLSAINNAKEKGTKLHLMGLLSSGGVHSHTEHIYALLKMAKMNDISEVYVHCFLDGRDTPPSSAMGFVAKLEENMKEIGVGKIATISGRYYAMDRDNRWDRVEKAYNAIAFGEGETADTAKQCMEKTYANEVYDEFVLPTVIEKNASVDENDSIIFFNFRPDRAREITRCFCDTSLEGFERKKGYIPVKFVAFTDYDATITNKEVAFKKEDITNTLGEYISSLGMTQARIAETEKYAHVTFFFNGGKEEPYKGEDRFLVPSPKVATYDLKPEMSAFEVTDKLIDAIEAKNYDLIVINYANPDMVGHTGNMEAGIKAVEAIDKCVGRVYESLIKAGGQMFICADHGNIDKIVDYDTKEPFTAHTTNPVPFIVINCEKSKGVKEDGKLCDIAPTLLDMMDIDKPSEMTGQSLLIK